MSPLNSHHAVGGPCPGGQSSSYSNINPLSPPTPTSQHMGSSHSKSTHPVPSSSVPFKGISAAVAGGIKIKRAFVTRRKKSESAEHDSPLSLSSVLSSSSAPTQLPSSPPPPPPPPTPPKHDKHLPLPLNSEQSRGMQRGSVLVISPAISPAVNYMLQQQQTPPSAAKSSPQPQQQQAPPSAAKSPSQQHQQQAPPSAAKSPAQPHQQQTPPPAAKSPPQPQPQQSPSVPKEPEKSREKEVTLAGTADNIIDQRETKESWRKSDSTNSHHTIRPGGGGGSTRTCSRPVSWAESFHSTHTVVQVSNKRLSALITDANFGMPEEDDESSVSASDSHLSKSTPSSLVRVKNRRSVSLDQGVPPTICKTPTLTEPKHPFSHSISEGVSPSTMLLNPQLTTSTAQFPAPTQRTHTSSTSIDTGAQSQPSTASNIRGRFAAWTAANTNSLSDNVSRQERTLPALPPQQRQPCSSQRPAGGDTTSPTSSTPTSFRQTAISMTASGIGPAAAGLAKRAVEKMGRKWGMGLSPSTSGSGSGYSSSSSSTNAPSSFSSASHTDYGLVRTSSNQSTPSVHSHIVKSSHSYGSAVGLSACGGGGKRRTPDAPSGAYSIHSVPSKSDNDPFSSSSGPILGTLLRGGLRSKNGVPVTNGIVFGRELKMVTRETAVNVGKVMRSTGMEGGRVKEGLVHELEERLIPAIVVRCAQHLLIWGVQEEGLFRVNGRPFHVSKLRSEFDSGVDYDMTECSPGDLDPHAVASVFKAYLRELPESILTQSLSPFFDAAIKKEASTNLPEQNRLSGVGRGNSGNPRLPQGSKDGFTVRKPPSLSTLAMPTFSGIPPPSTSLVADIKSLISQLPQENHDLLRTVIDLMKATGNESKKTKMPLSNLLLVFCPSLNMTPPLLKVFCEAEDIWVGGSEKVADSPTPPPLPMKDGQFAIAKQEEAEMTDTSEEMAGEDEDDEVEEKSLMSSERMSLDTTDDPGSGYHASEEEEEASLSEGQVVRRRWVSERSTERSEIPTVYLDTMSHYSSSSASSLREALEPSGRRHHHHHMNSGDDMVIADDGSISSASRVIHLVPLTSSPSPPLCSSSLESVSTSTSDANSSFSQLPVWKDEGGKVYEAGPVEIVDPDSKPVLTPGTTATHTNKASISHPVLIDNGAVQFPRLPNASPTRLRRASIPFLSLPNFSPTSLTSLGDVDRPGGDDSPSPSPTCASGGFNTVTKRSKRPSLRLLFSKNKKSGSSLNSVGEHSGGSGNGMSFISKPFLQYHPQQDPNSSTWESGTSDSSDSIPLSAVTAPSGMSSRSHLPPVLNTPIEDPSLSLGLGLDGSSPETPMPLKGDERMKERQKLAKAGVSVASPTPTTTTKMVQSTDLEDAPPQTPIASRISIVSAPLPPSPVTTFPVQSYPSTPAEPLHASSLSISQPPPLSLETRSSASSSGFSTLSEPSPQLSLLDDGGEEDEEDWTQSVLSAADRLS